MVRPTPNTSPGLETNLDLSIEAPPALLFFGPGLFLGMGVCKLGATRKAKARPKPKPHRLRHMQRPLAAFAIWLSILGLGFGLALSMGLCLVLAEFKAILEPTVFDNPALTGFLNRKVANSL